MTDRRFDWGAPSRDPYADALAERDRTQVSATLMTQTVSPDDAGKANRLSRSSGLPAEVVERDLPNIEAEQRARAWRNALQGNTALSGWMANPRNAAVAADDYDGLSLLGTIYQGIKDVGSTLRAGMEGQVGAGLYGVIRAAQETADTYNPIAWGERKLFGASIEGKIAQFAKGREEFFTAQADRSRPKVDNYWARNLLQGVESIPATIVGGAMALAGQPTAGLSLVAGTQAGQSYSQARRRGLSPARSALFGAEQGAIEYVTEKLPMSRLVGDLANKTPFMRTLVNQLAAELPQEQVATFMQDFTEWAALHPEKPVSAFLAERPSAALETALATIGGTVGNASVAAAVDRTARAAGRLSGRTVQAQQAAQDSAGLDALAGAAAKSKTRARDPQAFAELLSNLGGDTVENVHIPMDRGSAYFCLSHEWPS